MSRAETLRNQVVAIEPLTAAAFAQFGMVVAHASAARRHYFPEALEHLPEAAQASFWVSRVDAVTQLPLAVTMMERHPYTAQTFLPLRGGRYLAVVAASDQQGLPDLATARAFLACGHQGVTYHRDVWHCGMTVLDAPSEFAVLMHKTGRDDDDVFLELTRPFSIEPPVVPDPGV